VTGALISSAWMLDLILRAVRWETPSSRASWLAEISEPVLDIR